MTTYIFLLKDVKKEMQGIIQQLFYEKKSATFLDCDEGENNLVQLAVEDVR